VSGFSCRLARIFGERQFTAKLARQHRRRDQAAALEQGREPSVGSERVPLRIHRQVHDVHVGRYDAW
jgi:hypothetical protein